jgi:hypothetical protein
MGQHTDATIKANEDDARKGYVVSAPWGFFLLNERWPNYQEPILAWRIGKDPKCNCVLPVTCTGTHSSQCYVLYPDGRVRYNAVGYGSAPPDYESLAAWKKDMEGERGSWEVLGPYSGVMVESDEDRDVLPF